MPFGRLGPWHMFLWHRIRKSKCRHWHIWTWTTIRMRRLGSSTSNRCQPMDTCKDSPSTHSFAHLSDLWRMLRHTAFITLSFSGYALRWNWMPDENLRVCEMDFIDLNERLRNESKWSMVFGLYGTVHWPIIGINTHSKAAVGTMVMCSIRLILCIVAAAATAAVAMSKSASTSFSMVITFSFSANVDGRCCQSQSFNGAPALSSSLWLEIYILRRTHLINQSGNASRGRWRCDEIDLTNHQNMNIEQVFLRHRWRQECIAQQALGFIYEQAALHLFTTIQLMHNYYKLKLKMNRVDNLLHFYWYDVRRSCGHSLNLNENNRRRYILSFHSSFVLNSIRYGIVCHIVIRKQSIIYSNV